MEQTVSLPGALRTRRVLARSPVVPVRQRGVIAILFAIFLIVMIGMLGLAVDLSRVYNRKVELQGVADVGAMAAARQLVGTADSVDKAVAAAEAAAITGRFDYEKKTLSWSSSALRFATASDGPWMDAAAAKTSPAGVLFAKVDTSSLFAAGTLDTILMRALSSSLARTELGAVAIAGHSTINLTPLAICAQSGTPAEARPPAQELIEYGFRRGVAYDLMNLNSSGTTAATFVINPIDPAGRAGEAANTSAAVVGPFTCVGKLPMAHVLGGEIRVDRPFPLGSLYQQLNSRFDQYGGGYCKYQTAPPDINVKPFDFSGSNLMAPSPTRQAAVPVTEANAIRTVADIFPSHPAAADYGMLWTYARPVPYSAYLASKHEPEGGYVPFDKTAWKSLYAPAALEPGTAYPTDPQMPTPYESRVSANYTPPQASHGRGLPRRRVLNIALLDCPVAGAGDAAATVLAIGRFFMTVPATSTSLVAEFAGTATEQSLGAAVELYK